MLEKLKGLKKRYDALGARMAEPDAMQDMDSYRALVKEYASLEEIVSVYTEYERLEAEIAGCRHLLSEPLDADMKALFSEELTGLEAALLQQEELLRILLLPKDPNDDRDVIVEIRAGTGGDEASLFGADLLRMYERYAERNGYRIEYITSSLTDMNGVKEVVLSLSGKHGAYSRMKYESGVHRVQRVPATESQGRIHTSAATVAVLPEVDDVEVQLRDQDIRIDTYRSSGAGGQHVNKTESAIRITHLPTGIVVQCQDEKSQIKNKEQALRVLKSRLYEHFQSIQDEALASERKSLVGSGDRSQRIRTYNFPQGRVTDHRIGLTLYKLEQFLDGDMDELIDALILADRAKKLAGGTE